MSKFTTEVRYICEKEAGLDESVGYDDVNEVVKASHAKVIGEYPIFDEAYREVLDCKILKHYYTREICEETVGLWKLRLNNRMNEIMPFYNKMYASELLSFNPFYDVDLSSEHMKSEDTSKDEIGTYGEERNDADNKVKTSDMSEDGSNKDSSMMYRSSGESTTVESDNESKRNETSNVSSNESSEDRKSKNNTDKYSDTPQGGINGLSTGTYLTNARIIDETDTTYADKETGSSGVVDGSTQDTGKSDGYNDSVVSEINTNEKKNDVSKKGSEIESGSKSGSLEGNKKNEGSINSVENYLERVHGKRGGVSYSKLLMEYRDTFLNIDKMIINELSDLFFGLWA